MIPHRSQAGVRTTTTGRQRKSPSQQLERGVVRAAVGGDLAAREQVVKTCLPLVAGVARVYRNSGAVDRGELMQEGVVGLLRALNRFDPDRGTPFWAYASFWVRQAMQQLVAELVRPVVLSDRAMRQLACVKRARGDHLQEHRCEPSTTELSESTGIAREQIDRLIAVERLPRSIEERVGADGADTTVGELLADPVGEDDYRRVERRLDTAALRRQSELLGSRERLIVRARFGLDGREQTLREVAGTLALSAERVRQIEEGALEKLGAAQG